MLAPTPISISALVAVPDVAEPLTVICNQSTSPDVAAISVVQVVAGVWAVVVFPVNVVAVSDC